MSGPSTCVFTAEPATAILAAAAIRAAQAVQAGYREAAELREEHAERQDTQRSAHHAASATGQNALKDAVDRAEQRYAQLSQLAAPLGTAPALSAARPARPAVTDLQAMAAYVEQLKKLNRSLEDALQAEFGTTLSREETGIALDTLASDEALNLPASNVVPETAPAAALRLLARLADLGPLPPHIEALATEISHTTAVDRKEMLEIELRRAIQLFEEDAARSASALILEQTLKDLGYQVETVSDTLFVEGGVIHFRRAGWGNYQVRMRVNAGERRANFNVVRAVEAGENERSVLDHLAEDRWCAEFPALLEALGARGLHLEVTRRLAAGELPVQLVDRSQLPVFADEAERPSSRVLHQKERK